MATGRKCRGSKRDLFGGSCGFWGLSIAHVSLAVLLAVTASSEVLRGVDYGPYREGQNPDAGVHPTAEDIRADMPVLYGQACVLRTYSVLNGFDLIPAAARTQDLRVVPGAWIGGNAPANDAEVTKLVEVAAANADVPFVSVGSEAILRFERGWPDGLPEAQVLALIDRVKRQVNRPVTTAEPWHVWRDHPALAAAVDLLFVNVHPYWEGKVIDEAVGWVAQRRAELAQLYPTKRIVISETGWPTCGTPRGPAVPSVANQERFVRELLAWAESEKIELFYFEAFDEPWKMNEPNGVGPCWGLHDKDRRAKHAVASVKPAYKDLRYYTVPPCRVADTRSAAGPLGGPALAAGADRTFKVRDACGIPPTAKAITVNLTVTDATDAGDIRLFPAGGCTVASSLNYSAGRTRANNATTALDTNGELTVRSAQAGGTVHFILDVTGYHQ